MIWLLLNFWWLALLLIGLCAAVALLSGIGGPALLALARRVPAGAWAVLAAVLGVSLASGWLVGIGEARCQAKQEAREDKADVKAAGVAGRTAKKAQTDRTEIRKDTKESADEVRTIVRTVRAACPPVPDRVHDLGRAAVEAASAELPAGTL